MSLLQRFREWREKREFERSHPEFKEWRASLDPEHWEGRAEERRREFEREKKAYRRERILEGVKESYGNARALVGWTLSTLGLALLLLATAQGLPNLLGALGLLPVSAPASTPSWILALANFLSGLAPRDLLETVVQVSGIFLGLFFTALTVAFSARYANAPASVRDLFARHPLHRVYLKGAGLLTVFALLLLLIDVAGFQVTALSLAFVALLSLFVVLGTVELTPITFQHYDPTSLTGPVRRRLLDSIERVTPKGPRWDKPEFQQKAREVADEQLETYDDLCSDLTRPSRPSTKELAGLGSELQAARLVYAYHKPSIPPDSLWFPRTLSHPDIAETGGAIWDPNAETRKPVTAEQTPQRDWFEARIDDLTARVLRGLLSAGAHGPAEDLLEDWEKRLRWIAEKGHGRDAFRSARRLLSKTIPETIPTTDTVDADGVQEDEVASDLRLIERLTVVPFSVVASLVTMLEEGRAPDFSETIERVYEGDPRSIRELALGSEVMEKAVRLAEGLNWERKLHGQEITPRHHVIEELDGAHLQALEETVGDLASDLLQEYRNLLDRLQEGADPLFAAHFSLQAQHMLFILRHRLENLPEAQPK